MSGLGDDGQRRALGDLLTQRYNPWLDPDVAALEAELEPLRDRVVTAARERGYEIADD